jgi:hypothetical protein
MVEASFDQSTRKLPDQISNVYGDIGIVVGYLTNYLAIFNCVTLMSAGIDCLRSIRHKHLMPPFDRTALAALALPLLLGISGAVSYAAPAGAQTSQQSAQGIWTTGWRLSARQSRMSGVHQVTTRSSAIRPGT